MIDDGWPNDEESLEGGSEDSQPDDQPETPSGREKAPQKKKKGALRHGKICGKRLARY
jgi:hypothetical protein